MEHPMANENLPAALVLGVVGTGTMGRGIAQLAAAAGCRVILADARPAAAAEAVRAVGDTFAKLAARGKMTTEAAEQAAARLEAPAEPSFAECRVVVEAIAEDLEAKRALFTRLEGEIGDDCVLATNTSSLSVTAIAAPCRRPERVAGFHFFNPVPLMRIVEVVAGCRTSPEVVAFLQALGTRMGHFAVATVDTPGFLVNHAGRGYGPEALRVQAEGVATPAEIDRILVEQAGFRMGPFELFDLVGLDVSAAVMESIYEQFFHEPRFRPSALVRQRVVGGLLGRKSGGGFYQYQDGQIVRPPEPPAPPTTLTPPVWVSLAHPAEGQALTGMLAAAGIGIDRGARPGPESLCLVTPFGGDASSATIEEDLDPTRVVAVDALFGFAGRRVAMPSPATHPDMAAAARHALSQDGKGVSLIADSPGFVAQRVLAMIVNVACDIAQQRIARPDDIDRAVTLGLGYPKGPLAWGDAIGPGRLTTILETLHRLTGEPRWRPSPWLRRRAQLGLSLLAP
jgi:3-hydroxybutyryl-CoA dehydrogenase